MTRKLVKNNKGFSLVELIIAVAVMALLIAPIVKSLITTLNQSAKAKEKQYVVDDADKVMEYFKKQSVKELAAKSDTSVSISSINTANVSCAIYDASGTSSEAVTYSVTDYTLGQAELGRKKNKYNRKVMTDDLSVKLLAKGYKVKNDYTKDSDLSGLTGFEVNNDGEAVHKDSNGHVDGIVCVTADKITDPNEMNLGDIQNIDQNTMYIIQGDATTLDQQFQKDFLGNSLAIVQQNKNTLSSFSEGAVSGYDDYLAKLNDYLDQSREAGTFSRDISIYIKANKEGSKIKSYTVSGNIYYRAIYQLKGLAGTIGTGAHDNDKYVYKLPEREFFTSEAPDVLFYYEPFILSNHSTSTFYAKNDYITIYADEDVATGDEKAPKVYLIKPEKTWQSATGAETGRSDYNSEMAVGVNSGYYNKVGSTSKTVNININQVVDSGKASSQKPLKVYTNIGSEWDDAEHTTVKLASDQFSSNLIDSSTDSATNPVSPTIKLGGQERIAYDSSCILPVQKDERKDGKLYNIYVEYEREDGTGDKTYFSGAKGAN